MRRQHRRPSSSKHAVGRGHAGVQRPEPLPPSEPAATEGDDKGPAPRGFRPLLQSIAVNAVPLQGIWRAGWSTPTTLAVYWCENVLGALLVAVRLLLHRHLTHARGYERNQLGVTFEMTGTNGRLIQGFVPEFLAGSLGFSLLHGVFLAFVLAVLLPSEGGATIDPAAVRRGVITVGGFLLLGFLMDLPRLGERPFAWARDLAQRTLARVMVVHLTIVIGTVVMAWQHQPGAFIGVFAGLKTLLDASAHWPRGEVSRRVPRWLAWLARKAKPGESPQGIWESTLDREKALAAADEKRRDDPAGLT
jgi:hypothetical protein